MNRLEKRLSISTQLNLEEIIHGYDECDLRSSEPKPGDVVEIYSEGNYSKIPSLSRLPIGRLMSLIDDEQLDQHSMNKLIKAVRKMIRYKSDGGTYRLTSGSTIDIGEALANNVAGYPEAALLITLAINYHAQSSKSNKKAHCEQGYIFRKGRRINGSSIYIVYSEGKNKYIIDLYNGSLVHVNNYSVSFGTGKGHAQVFEDFSGNIVAISQYSTLFRPRS